MRRREVLAMVGAGLSGLGAGVDGLAAYRWRKRLVVVFCAPGDRRLVAQRRVLEQMAGDGDGRDLVLIAVVGDRVDPPVEAASTLPRRLDVGGEGFTALLIGKDGGVKLRSHEVLDAPRLARTIDAMPMRQAETRTPRAR